MNLLFIILLTILLKAVFYKLLEERMTARGEKPVNQVDNKVSP